MSISPIRSMLPVHVILFRISETLLCVHCYAGNARTVIAAYISYFLQLQYSVRYE